MCCKPIDPLIITIALLREPSVATRDLSPLIINIALLCELVDPLSVNTYICGVSPLTR